MTAYGTDDAVVLHRARRSSIALLLLAMAACDSPEPSDGGGLGNRSGRADGAPPHVSGFEDGFEGSRQLTDLLATSSERWTHVQNTKEGQNFVRLTTARRRSGDAALEMRAITSSMFGVSKADVEKEGFEFRAGEQVTLRGWFWIDAETSLYNVFLLDIECSPKACGHDQSPGVRVMLKGDEGFPALDRGKIGFSPAWAQTAVAVPRGRWFELSLVLDLGMGEAGRSRLYVDNRLALDHRGTNLPDAQLFRSKYGVELTDQKYDRVQLGITANASLNTVTLFLDDVQVGRTGG